MGAINENSNRVGDSEEGRKGEECGADQAPSIVRGHKVEERSGDRPDENRIIKPML